MTVNLVGGEMPQWSDLAVSPAAGPTLSRLLTVAGGRTLVAGPHSPELIDAIPAGDLTLLVRGLADAETLDARYAQRPGTSVWCGSVEKVAQLPVYDTVIALAGLDRLVSAESDDLSWAATLDTLVALLRPGGRLLLATENLFGLHRLLALPTPPTDADWVVPDDHDPYRPGGHADLRSRLESAGLTVRADLAAYPSPASPSLLLGADLLAEKSLSGFVTAALTAAAAPRHDQLADPARLATGALRAGLSTALAPGWVILAAAPGATVEHAPPSTATVEHPPPNAATVEHPPPSAATAALSPSSQARPTVAAAGGAGWPAGVVGDREIHLPATDLPRGRTLADHLIAACQRRDLPAVRQLLTSWLAGPAAGVPAAAVVVTPDGAHVPLAPATGTPVTALRDLAITLIRGGYADLWPAPADPAALTATLAAMTGRELRPDEVPPAPPRDHESLRELTADRDRLARELAEARAKHGWYESMLNSRETELKRVRQINTVLKATAGGRAATTVAGGLRAGKRALRAVVRRARG